MMDKINLTSRQSAIVPQAVERLNILVIGAGGIGSNVIETLARTGIDNLLIVDPDDVAEENVYPGAFIADDIGRPKVIALAQRYSAELNARYIEPIPERFNEWMLSEHFDVVITGLDSMDARREVWESLQSNLEQWDLLIDGRMGGAGFEIHSVGSGDDKGRERYNEDVWHTNPLPLPCGEKATSFVTRTIGGLVTAMVRNYATGKPVARLTLYDADLGLLIQEASEEAL